MSASPPRTRVDGPETDRIPIREKLIYGAAGIADLWGANTINRLQVPILVIALGISPSIAGLLNVIFRLWDGVSDPIFGWISDNTRTRWGRRRPFMLVGGILLGVTLPLVFLVRKEWGPTGVIAWLLVTGLVTFTAHSSWNVPYQSLLFEMTPDTEERTNLSAVRAYFQQGASVVHGLIWFFITLPVFRTSAGALDTLFGTRVVVGVMSAILLAVAILPAIFLRERYYKTASVQSKVSIRANFRLTFKNRPFLLLAGFSLVYIVGSQFAFGLFNFARYYYVAQGNELLAAKLTGIDGVLATVCGLAGVPFAQWVARRKGKPATLVVSSVLSMGGAVLSWFTYTSAAPYLSLICNPLLSFAGASIWVIIPSMTADIADYDELLTHERREGAFASIFSWIVKMTISIGVVLPGPLIELAGFDVHAGAHQTGPAILGMRLMLALVPVVIMFPALFVLNHYPLTTRRMLEVRSELEARRGKL